MIPAFNDGNFLPEGNHPATWEEVVERFGGGAKRKGFCDRLIAWLKRAEKCGFLRVYLFGSFISAKDDPGDVDLMWIHKQNLEYDRLSRECHELVETDMLKRREGWDMYCCSDDPTVIDGFLAVWGKDKAPGRKSRGVILVDLKNL